MDGRTKTVRQQVDAAAGQIAALGVACRVLLAANPDKAKLAAEIHRDLEGTIATLMAQGFTDEFLRGIEAARDLFLLKKPADPGQPTRSA